MIKHYLKTGARVLMKYKMHSVISVICLAIGISCFCVVNYLINSVSTEEKVPGFERQLSLYLFSDKTAADQFFYKHDIDYVDRLSIRGLDSLVASSYAHRGEVTTIDNEQRELPFLIKYQCVSAGFFAYRGIKLLYGSKTPEAPDEVLISEEFAKKAFGKGNPIGMSIRIDNSTKQDKNIVTVLKVVNVAKFNKLQLKESSDLYCSIGLNPYLPLTVNSYLTGDVAMKELKNQLKSITWKREDATISIYAGLVKDYYNSVESISAKLLVRFLSALILLSGLINFLKFIIQLFYNRQRELAIRRCVGSDVKGLFSLLFVEIFWMMSIAFFLSMVVTEVGTRVVYLFIPEDSVTHLPMGEIYLLQFYLYIALLLICSIIILYPVYRLRGITIVQFVSHGQRKHLFRNIMMGIQLAISLFFVGMVFIVSLTFNEISRKQYAPLSTDEEDRIITLTVNSIHMKKNLESIFSEIEKLPEVTERIGLSESFRMNQFSYMDYEKDGKKKKNVLMIAGDPSYFRFFHIPMEGKVVEKEAFGTVYVSEQFNKELLKDSINGSIRLSGTEYQIAGTFPALYKEGSQFKVSGSVFMVTDNASTYYFKTEGSKKVSETLKSITSICRKYIPESLPLDIRILGDTTHSEMGIIYMIRSASLLLAVISILLVVLSIYSAISMDTLNRQKEVALRKINGATSKNIAFMFGKTYIIIYLISFFIIFPFIWLLGSKLSEGIISSFNSWTVGIMLFVSMAALVFVITAYKIYDVMRTNPATVIRKE